MPTLISEIPAKRRTASARIISLAGFLALLSPLACFDGAPVPPAAQPGPIYLSPTPGGSPMSSPSASPTPVPSASPAPAASPSHSPT